MNTDITKQMEMLLYRTEDDEVTKIATTTQHGAMQNKTQTNATNYYNLDAIISVGYRVNSI